MYDKRYMMIIPILILCIFITCVFVHNVFARSSENYCITADVVCTGGTETETESENYYLFGTVGQSVISIITGESETVDLDAGFHYHVKGSSTPDDDDLCFADDNCPLHPNSGDLGTCANITSGPTCTSDGDCGGELCSMDQEDSYPPGGNGIGDACDCEGNFDCDADQDGSDAAAFKENFGRSPFQRPCANEDQCKGDFDCDVDVDGTDAALFKSDFGRSSFNNPCPACIVGDWCVYE